jgi:hypothetical protein
MADHLSESAVNVLLSRFPGPIFLKRGRKDESPSALLLIPPILATISFLVNVVQGYSILGWISVVLFSLLTVVTAIYFRHPPSAPPGLTLDAESFQQRLGFMTSRSLWADSSNFTVAPVISPISGRPVDVLIWYHNISIERSWWGRLVLMVFPLNAAVGPVDDLTIEQLADLMRLWCDRAQAHARQGPR